jgi:hypothetical protein
MKQRFKLISKRNRARTPYSGCTGGSWLEQNYIKYKTHSDTLEKFNSRSKLARLPSSAHVNAVICLQQREVYFESERALSDKDGPIAFGSKRRSLVTLHRIL